MTLAGRLKTGNESKGEQKEEMGNQCRMLVVYHTAGIRRGSFSASLWLSDGYLETASKSFFPPSNAVLGDQSAIDRCWIDQLETCSPA